MKINNVRIVLVETSHPGNIGAVARAMKNMCLDQLYLVNPEEYPSAVATARASGADDVLSAAKVCSSLENAISDCHLVVGASARLRSVEWPIVNPRECAEKIAADDNSQQIAIVFGREDSGLTNDELARCQYLVHIPTNPEYSSLNIAAAVQVICYETFMAVQAKTNNSNDEEKAALANQESATSAEMEGFYVHLEKSLTEIGFLKPPSCQKLLRRLRRLFNRAGPDKTDIDILRGILSAAEGRKYEWQKRQNSDISNK